MPEERDLQAAGTELASRESASRSPDGSLAVSSLLATLTSGPIPPPETLAKYDEIVPGLAKTIVDNWLEESRHRRTEDSFTRREHWRNQSRGQIFAFVATILFFTGSMILIYQGHEASGIGVLIAQIAALAGVFIFGKMKAPKDQSSTKTREDLSESP